jgi:hypothetical protein
MQLYIAKSSFSMCENMVPENQRTFPPGKHLYIFHPGEQARNQPRWQVGLNEDGSYGISILSPVAVPGMGWRFAGQTHRQSKLDIDSVNEILNEVLKMQERYPNECFRNEDLWADSSEKGNSVSRHKATNAACITIGIQERGEWTTYFSMAEASPGLLESRLSNWINSLLA